MNYTVLHDEDTGDDYARFPLANAPGKHFLVDDRYADWVDEQGRWYLNPRGYVTRHDFDGGTWGTSFCFRLHRCIAADEEDIDGKVIHHVNGDRQDNRKCNLQVMTSGDHTRLHKASKKAANLIQQPSEEPTL